MVGFGEKVKGFLVSPVSTFNEVKDETMGPAVKYFIILALVFSILWAIIIAVAGSMIMGSFGGAGGALLGGMAGGVIGIVMFILLLIMLIVFLFIGSAILHVFVYIVGGRKGYTQTLKAVAYGSTPGLLLGWIPFIGIIFGIWALIVEILGIRELHEISTGRAVLAVLIPVIIGIIIAAITAAIYVHVGGTMPPYPPTTP